MIRRLAAVALVLAAGFGAPAMAQPAPPAPLAAAPIDPARLALATEFIERTYPPEVRRQIMTGTMAAMDSQVRVALSQAMPALAEPSNQQLFERYLQLTKEYSKDALETATPALYAAMARAYARQFTLAELREINAFAATPAGAKLLRTSTEILTDPDVAAANTAYMKDVFGAVEKAIVELTSQAAAAEPASDEK